MPKPSKSSSKDPLAEMFDRSEGVVKNRLIWRSQGEWGTGKTHFALGAPGPIVMQSFDQGLEGVAIEEYGKKDIYPIEYDWAPDAELEQDAAIELRDQFIKDFAYACKHARTILWDKETQVWELFRYAQFGAPNDAPRNYPALNQRYIKHINFPKSLDINFGLIQSMKDEWKTIKAKKASGEVVEKGASTGNRIPSGFGELEGLVHVNLYHRRENGKFYIKVGKARGPGAHAIQDQEFGPMSDDAIGMSFAEFAELAFPETTEEDWQ